MKRTVQASAVAGAALAGLACNSAADAQAYPTKPIHMLVPCAPGGIVDVTTRLVRQGMQQALGQTVVIDDRSGAAGVIASEIVATAAPDGYPAPTPGPAFANDVSRDIARWTKVARDNHIVVTN